MWNGLLAESTSLFDDFDWLSREMDRLFEPFGSPALRSVGRASFPTLNVATEEDSVHVLVFAPGIAAADLDVSMQGNVLSVKGKRALAQAGEDGQIWVNERFTGEFARTVTLPEDVDPGKVEAQSRDGVLWVRVKRQESARPRKIQVH